ncbi:MAG: helix-turn-helix domain-containing protein [Bacteroidales bacterium]|nr:helix-turn-helix domain-containing protein [Candidatus Cryptobacteroides equifaecalis]
MNKRIQQFLAAENITQSQFADSINVARASVSHIIAGRNKPGFDFIENMARRYPSLNLEWLITGKGRMYKSDDESYSLFSEPAAVNPPAAVEVSQNAPAPVSNPQTPPVATVLPDTVEEDLPEDTVEEPFYEEKPQIPESRPSVEPQPLRNTGAEPAAETAAVITQASAGVKNTIRKMIVLFSDGTYQELVGKE